MNIIFRMCAIGLVALLLVLFVKQYNLSIAVLVALAACIAMIYMLVPQIKALFDFCNLLIESAGLQAETVLPVFKVLLVAICAKITAQLCKDSGQGALAVNIEIGGAVCGIICALPLLQEALRLIGGIG